MKPIERVRALRAEEVTGDEKEIKVEAEKVKKEEEEESEARTFKCHGCGGRKQARRSVCLGPCPM